MWNQPNHWASALPPSRPRHDADIRSCRGAALPALPRSGSTGFAAERLYRLCRRQRADLPGIGCARVTDEERVSLLLQGADRPRLGATPRRSRGPRATCRRTAASSVRREMLPV